MDLLKLIKNFNSSAKDYEKKATEQKKIAKMLFNIIHKDKKYKKVLEAGCGTGFLTELLIKNFNPEFLLLNDISLNMLKICIKKFKENSSLHTYHGDFLKLKTKKKI